MKGNSDGRLDTNIGKARAFLLGSTVTLSCSRSFNLMLSVTRGILGTMTLVAWVTSVGTMGGVVVVVDGGHLLIIHGPRGLRVTRLTKDAISTSDGGGASVVGLGITKTSILRE